VVVPDNATAVSGTWTNIHVMANDAGNATRITSVSRPTRGGTTQIVTNTTGKDHIRYMSQNGFSGRDSFNYTTADGTATVTVDVAPGPCVNNRCGQLGNCSGGVCSCAAYSGAVPRFVANPDVAARATTPRFPTCRYPGEHRQKLQQCCRMMFAASCQELHDVVHRAQNCDSQPKFLSCMLCMMPCDASRFVHCVVLIGLLLVPVHGCSVPANRQLQLHRHEGSC
jgi:hypothetical protein